MTEKANFFYKLFISWTNEKIKKTYDRRNMFEFKHIKSLDWSYVDQPGPMVVFATPGMLHAGSSLQVCCIGILLCIVLVLTCIYARYSSDGQRMRITW